MRLIFPHTLALNAPAVPAKTKVILEALGSASGTSGDVLGGARQFCEGLGLDMRLRAHAIPKEAFASMATEAHSIRRLLDSNPVDVSAEEIARLYDRAW